MSSLPNIACLIALAGTSIITAAPSAAGGSVSRAVCIAQVRATAPDGLTAAPRRVDYTARGRMNCIGDIRGRRASGPADWSERGHVDGSCLSGVVTAVVDLVIPTADGTLRLQLAEQATYAGAAGVRLNADFPGGLLFRPVRGDCVTSPATEVEAIVWGVLIS